MAFANLEEIINLAEKLIKYITNYILDNNLSELKYLENHDKENQKTIINKLKKITAEEFKKIDRKKKVEKDLKITTAKLEASQFLIQGLETGLKENNCEKDMKY